MEAEFIRRGSSDAESEVGGVANIEKCWVDNKWDVLAFLLVDCVFEENEKRSWEQSWRVGGRSGWTKYQNGHFTAGTIPPTSIWPISSDVDPKHAWRLTTYFNACCTPTCTVPFSFQSKTRLELAQQSLRSQHQKELDAREEDLEQLKSTMNKKLKAMEQQLEEEHENKQQAIRVSWTHHA